MADDDDLPDDEVLEEEEVELEADPDEVEPDELDDDFEELDDDDDNESFADGELDESLESDDGAETGGPATPRRRAAEDEDEDDDLLAPDDVEADLDTILKDRLVTADEAGDEEDDELEAEERGGEGDRLQPKRPDEQLCSNCFLLVRRNAPNCPVGDDSCPLFS
jgi:hypothetical protein